MCPFNTESNYAPVNTTRLFDVISGDIILFNKRHFNDDDEG